MQHTHHWAVVDFGLVDDKPMMRQRCECGAERTIPAWDRTWQPRPSGRLVQAEAGSVLGGRLLERLDAPEGAAHIAHARLTACGLTPKLA